MNTSLPPKPNLVTVVAVATLINGIVNVIYGLSLTIGTALGTLGVALQTFGIGCIGLLCVPLTILPTILGIFEIIYAARILPNPIRPTRPSQALAILEIVNVISGNLLSPVVGILALIFYGDPQVKAYFEAVNAAPSS